MLVITNVRAVTMDPQRRILDDAAIAVTGDRITAIGDTDDVVDRFPGADSIAGRGMVALPGLIDAHCHADQSLLRGLTDDLEWVPFLSDWIDPYLTQRSPGVAVAAYRLSMLEMIRSGTTCFVSPNVDPRDDWAAIVGAIERFGLRSVLAYWTDSPAALPGAAAAMDRWDGAAEGRVHVRIGLDIPRLPGDRDQPDLYRELAGQRLVYHFCSELEDEAWSVEEQGLRPAEWAQRNGLLGRDTLLINGCHVSPAEIAVLAETATPLVHSPSANMKMASGVAPVPDLRSAGVVVALGTDGAANNNSFDLFGEMKAACLLQNITRRRPGSLRAADALEMATVEGARALGRADELGSLEEGKLADIILVDLARPHTWPVHDVTANLVFASCAGNVDTVMVNGRVLMQHGRVAVCDEGTVLAEAAAAAATLDFLPAHPARS